MPLAAILGFAGSGCSLYAAVEFIEVLRFAAIAVHRMLTDSELNFGRWPTWLVACLARPHRTLVRF